MALSLVTTLLLIIYFVSEQKNQKYKCFCWLRLCFYEINIFISVEDLFSCLQFKRFVSVIFFVFRFVVQRFQPIYHRDDSFSEIRRFRR